MNGVFRRRRADQHIADVPGRDLIHQAARLAVVVLPLDLAQGFGAAKPRIARIELRQVLQADADAAKSHRQSGHLVLRQHQIDAGLFQPRRQP